MKTFIVAALLVLGLSTSQAAVIVLNNASFESGLTGWSSYGGVGVVSPDPDLGNQSGNNVVYVQIPSTELYNGLEQTTSETLAAGTYTFSLDLAAFVGESGTYTSGSGFLYLVADESDFTFATLDVSYSDLDNTLTAFTITATLTGSESYIGDTLIVGFQAYINSNTEANHSFALDNAQATFTAVPEPSTVLLLGLGVVGLVLLRRLPRRQA